MIINPTGDGAPTERLNKNPLQTPGRRSFRQPSQPKPPPTGRQAISPGAANGPGGPLTSRRARTGRSTSGNAKPPTGWASPG